ncbi:transporter substrate-binding domain-containing protein [Streptococcus danieliae]|nr:transporter substrate-binding domain-containing protein [Streptococcus danieliae]
MNLNKILKKVGLLALGLTLTACASGSEAASLEAIQAKGKLVVATSPDYAPFEFQTLIDGKNQVVGADISLAQDIADELGVDLEVSAMSFDNVLTSIRAPLKTRSIPSYKKEGTLALQFPAKVPVFPTFLSRLSGEF